MSISEDIKALEEALNAKPLTHPGVALVEKAVLSRVLDALKERNAWGNAAIELAHGQSRAEIRLSKAIELLKMAESALDDLPWDSETRFHIRAFLSQDSQT